jgi:glutamate-ammonia-ligase adenylyltransferase
MDAAVLLALERLDAARADAGLSPVAGAARAALGRVFDASPFVADVLRADPALADLAVGDWLRDAAPPAARFAPPQWPAPDDDTAMRVLRRFRRAESARLVVRDVLGVDAVRATLEGATALAETCIEQALRHLEPAFHARHGTPRLADGTLQRLVVIGMGKLGGGELNFSSDIDLVFAYAEPGTCVGGRALDFEDFYARLGQRLAQLLGETTADGLCYRVDLRLRPFGSVGRMALPFAAMEQYYQREGRDWERYAWIKARPVAGDLDGGRRLLAALAPFVYRRYLDFTAIDGLRSMKRLIDAEVARKDLAQHVKLGPGGIRELEFMVQLVQLVRGGREPALRTPSFYAALDAAVAAGHAPAEFAAPLREAYDFLRHVENRLQMRDDAQVHELPDDEVARAALARGLGFADWAAFDAALSARRALVASAFAELLAPGTGAPSPAESDWAAAWTAFDPSKPALSAPFGPEGAAALRAYATGAALRGLDERSRARIDRLLPAFLAACAASPRPDDALARVLRLLAAVAGRATYLALLDERPAARERLVATVARSAWLAERVIAHPLLLDDLLDARVAGPLPETAALRAAMDAAVAEAGADVEAALERVHELRHSALFRLALAWLARRLPAVDLAARLAGVAEATVAAVVAMALADTTRTHGPLADDGGGSGFAVIGYGSLGGRELGFGSDLDLVFLYHGALAARSSRGARALEGPRWFARVAQRAVHWLTTPMRAGALYAVDTRLRPDGAKGLLVVSLEGFLDYQRERAWTWEHQALVRARAVAGDAALCAGFEAGRLAVLGRARDPALLDADVARMRARWRAELDRSDATRFDLKQGRGGSVDLEFILQREVLARAASAPSVAGATDTPALLERLVQAGALDAATAATLRAAHAVLLERGLDATLDGQPRLAPREAVAEAAAAIAAAWSARFGEGPIAA